MNHGSAGRLERVAAERVIEVGHISLCGFLEVPAGAKGVVAFAHGSGSSRFSRRNNAVAAYLRDGNLGTLLFDLLTPDEERRDLVTREHRFDIPLLSRRLQGAVAWLAAQPGTADLMVGLFGSSTGAAAALIAAAALPDKVAAVVSRGGRADLAGAALPHVRAATLLIVGGADTEVLRLNRAAQSRLTCRSELAVVPHATHLFEEPGALEQVASLTRDWFVRHLRPDQSVRRAVS
ncbi:MAG TPA: acyl-CoA thioester hydrolase/BAAT C-terminal domain-containing protein [Woeseiaceae bacterium]